MLLIFSLQPNDINAAPTSQGKTTPLEVAKQYLQTSKDVKGVLKQYAEFFGVVEGHHPYTKEQPCDVDAAVVLLNNLESVRPSVAKPFSWTGDDKNYMVKIKLIDGPLKHDVDIDLGPRNMEAEAETLSSLQDHLNTVAFPCYNNRNTILNCADHIGGKNVEGDADGIDDRPIPPFSLTNGWFFEVTNVVSAFVDGSTGEQTRSIVVTVKNKVDGDTIGSAYIDARGPVIQREAPSDYEKSLFDKLQTQIETAARVKWIIATTEAAAAGESWDNARAVSTISCSGSVDTVFEHHDDNQRFTVTTVLEGVNVDGPDALKYELASSVGTSITFRHTVSVVQSDLKKYIQFVNEFKKQLLSEVKDQWSEQIRVNQNVNRTAQMLRQSRRTCKDVESTLWFELYSTDVEVTSKLLGLHKSDDNLIIAVQSNSKFEWLRGKHLVTIPLIEDVSRLP
eukprot:GHVS01083818.1.p1 GENE.GHVS01083818.1~~GHVS01083818.1.p1  ORF type:complete len:481 (+),score=41.31 GHVS01083818.1:92-1444(+)